VPQPFGDRFSLDLDDQQIRAITAERVKSIAGSMPQSNGRTGPACGSTNSEAASTMPSKRNG